MSVTRPRRSTARKLAACGLAGLVAVEAIVAHAVWHASIAGTAIFLITAAILAVVLARSPAAPVSDPDVDALTGLRNHRAFRDDLNEALESVLRDGRVLTLALLDIDDFRAVNDANGHRFGDRILVQIAERIAALTPAVAYRIGGDTFAIVSTRATIADLIADLERMQAEPATPAVSFSAGVATTAASDDPDAIFEQADAALYEAKRSRRGSLVAFERERLRETLISSAKARALLAIIDAPDLDVVFQPIWEIGGTVLGYEALVRPHPRHGFGSTQELFDIAERLRRTAELDTRCCAAIVVACTRLPAGGLLFINVSPQTLDVDRSYGRWLLETILAAGMTPDRIVVELTERSLARVDIVVEHARALSAMGFRIALDDTGAGNAGLQMLSRLPVDFIKIDHDVITHAPADVSARGILAGIIAIADTTGSYVIAEGIETEDILSFVRDFAPRVHALQGFYLAPPQPEPIDQPAYARGSRIVLSSSVPRDQCI